MLTPDWTPTMQRTWDRAMLIARTRGAYGVGFPLPGTSFTPPTPGTMLHDLCFVCSSSEEEYEAHLQAVREDMTAWKARVRSSGNKKRELITKVNLSGVDLTKLEIKL